MSKKIFVFARLALAFAVAFTAVFASPFVNPENPNNLTFAGDDDDDADWSVATGDDHQFNVTVNYEAWDGTGSLWVLAYYGNSDTEGVPDGYAEVGEPGAVTVYVPHTEGETEVNFFAAWYDEGTTPANGDDPGSGVGESGTNPFDITGGGPTGAFVTVFGGGDDDDDDGYPDIGEASGDDHEFTLTLTVPGWDETGSFYIVAWYGEEAGEDPDGVTTVDGPGEHTIYIPHAEGQTNVFLAAIWYPEGNDFGDEMGGFDSTAESIEGDGPSEIAMEIDLSGDDDDDDDDEEVDTDWSDATGDDHQFNVTVNYEDWDETGSLWILAYYGNSDSEGDPDGYVELGAPGSVAVYVPHDEAETEVNFYAAWYEEGTSPLDDDDPATPIGESGSNPYTIAGAGPTGAIVTVFGGGDGDDDDDDEEEDDEEEDNVEEDDDNAGDNRSSSGYSGSAIKSKKDKSESKENEGKNNSGQGNSASDQATSGADSNNSNQSNSSSQNWSNQFISELTSKNVLIQSTSDGSNGGTGGSSTDRFLDRMEMVRMILRAIGAGGYDESEQETLQIAKARNIINDPDKFQPERKVNRAEALRMLIDGFGFNVDAVTYKASFPDVDQNAWYAKYVNFATEIGIISGYQDGTFGPGNNISEAEAAKIIALFLIYIN